ncbi:MAG TPA: isoprenylcysteine carboxylmethyltransferase family protein [Spirochaetota bacterium]|nr:isoprenylcysteine carboxylmethyltransferase family protein [Spirochaetota bacterium]
MNIIGKTTINPIFFFTGKVSSYLTWIFLVLSLLNVFNFLNYDIAITKYVSYPFLIIGLFFTIISMINLGKSTRLGLPSEDTKFKTNGLYKISRNPMYLGFNFMTLASMLYTLNILIIVMGLYSFIIYHLIILGEEKFLDVKFGKEYYEYKNRIKRYLLFI